MKQGSDAVDVAGDMDAMIEATRAAGAVVTETFGTDMAVRHKSPDQPLTDADIAADRLLRERLLAARPSYGWLSEETADNPGRLAVERVWVVDPIDGTRSFIARRPEFSVSVALSVRGVAVAGVIFNPATGELFRAVRGGGAWLDDASGGTIRLGADRTAVTGATGQRTIMASRSEIARGEFSAFNDWAIEPMGSTAYKMALVAAGRADAFLSRGPKSEWDVCAGVVILEEAGAVVTDSTGAPFVFNQPAPSVRGVLAASPHAHALLLDAMNRHGG